MPDTWPQTTLRSLSPQERQRIRELIDERRRTIVAQADANGRIGDLDNCEQCQATFERVRANQRFCSLQCRKRHWRKETGRVQVAAANRRTNGTRRERRIAKRLEREARMEHGTVTRFDAGCTCDRCKGAHGARVRNQRQAVAA